MFFTLLLIGCAGVAPQPTGCPPQDQDCRTIELQTRTEVESCIVSTSKVVCRARSTRWPYSTRTLWCTNTRTPICDRQRD